MRDQKNSERDRGDPKKGLFTWTRAAALVGLAVGAGLLFTAGFSGSPPSGPFRLWAMSCAHIPSDLAAGRESLATAIRQSELGGEEGGTPFDWDVAVHLGDLTGNQVPPTDQEGREVLRQFSAAKRHRREHFYNVAGNHDASGPDEPTQWWFKKWIDPLGKNSKISGVVPSRRPYPITGTWERYSFRVGNVLFLMMSDRNDGGPPVGRGPRGGYPAGAVSGETFQWWKRMVEANPDKIIISAHHHMLKATTVGSGPGEGMLRTRDGDHLYPSYHGGFKDGAPEGTGYLYFVDGQPDAQAFERYLERHPGAIALWLGGHTHTFPADRQAGRGLVETKWGVHFVNVAALTLHHRGAVPMSRLLTFLPGSDRVHVRYYLHTSDYPAQGWHPPAERSLPLAQTFAWDEAR